MRSGTTSTSVLAGNMKDPTLHEHLLLRTSALDTYDKVKNEIKEYLVAKKQWSSSGAPDSMEIGAFQRSTGAGYQSTKWTAAEWMEWYLGLGCHNGPWMVPTVAILSP